MTDEEIYNLLDKGFDPNQVDDSRRTPLENAVRYDRPNIIKLLLKYGADPNFTESYSPLFLASYSSEFIMYAEEMAKSLLEAGADPNFRTEEDETPLSYASKEGSTNMVELLLKYRANDYDEAIKVANKNKYDEIVSLIELYRVLHKKEEENLFEMNMFKAPDKNLVRKHIDMSLKINPLKMREEEIQKLLDKGADPNQVDSSRRTPLENAVRYERPNIVKLLLKYGADPNFTKSYSPLVLVSYYGFMKTAKDMGKSLLEFGADPNFRTEEDETPLSIASKEGYIDMVELLLKYGAADYDEAIKVANYDKYDQIVSLISSVRELYHAVRYNQVAMVKSLLEDEADPNFRTQEGKTLLSIVSSRGNIDILELLLSYGATDYDEAIRVANKDKYDQIVELIEAYRAGYELQQGQENWKGIMKP